MKNEIDNERRIDITNKSFFGSAIKSLPLEISAAANFSAPPEPLLVFPTRPEVSGKRQKPKINYMAADGSTENFQGGASFFLLGDF